MLYPSYNISALMIKNCYRFLTLLSILLAVVAQRITHYPTSIPTASPRPTSHPSQAHPLNTKNDLIVLVAVGAAGAVLYAACYFRSRLVKKEVELELEKQEELLNPTM